MEFVSKPQPVEALQWIGNNGLELLAHLGDKVEINHRGDHVYFCLLLAGKGGAQEWVPVPVGHWLVHPPGDLSDIWPVEDEYFQVKYVSADHADEYVLAGYLRFVESDKPGVVGEVIGRSVDEWALPSDVAIFRMVRSTQGTVTKEMYEAS